MRWQYSSTVTQNGYQSLDIEMLKDHSYVVRISSSHCHEVAHRLSEVNSSSKDRSGRLRKGGSLTDWKLCWSLETDLKIKIK